ncbi:MAG: FtsQ-type POTRA domain-containing protein [Chloroflexota bacterium]
MRRQTNDSNRKPQRLRKQPKRRLHSATAVPLPRMEVPKTAQRRRRRNAWQMRVPTAALRRLFLSARWVSLSLLLMAIYALVLIGADINFYLTYIPVEGSFTIPPADIVQASDLAGTHIFAADPGLAAAQIADLPGVISATVTVGWPNEVLIRIREDNPVAIWEEGGQDFWVTENGRLTPARTGSIGLLRIRSEMGGNGVATAVDEDTAFQLDDNMPAESIQSSLAFMPADVLVGALQLRDLRPNIEALYYRPAGGLSYEDGRGWRVYFGTGNDMAQKMVIYEAIVEDLLARGLTPAYISVSNKEKPYYRPQ